MNAKNCNLDLSSITLEVINAPSDCVYKSGNKFNLTEIVPPNECLLALHEVIPYHLTLKNKGYFKWQKNANAVITQCPNPEVAVAIGVVRESRGKTKKIRAKVVAARSEKCPKKYKKGKQILKTVINNKRICLLALDVLLPYILFLEAAARAKEKVRPILIQCADCDVPARFKLKLHGLKSVGSFTALRRSESPPKRNIRYPSPQLRARNSAKVD